MADSFLDSHFLQKMRLVTTIGDETARLLADNLERDNFSKKELVLQAGKYCQYVWLLERGFIRHYWLVDGEEVTTSFSLAGTPIFSMDEMYYGRESEEYAMAMEPSEAWRIRISDMEGLLRTNLELATWWRILHQNEYRRVLRSFKERLTLPAKERYEAFCKEFPEVSRKSNLGHIASYLGVTLPTLSHIRAEFNVEQNFCQEELRNLRPEKIITDE